MATTSTTDRGTPQPLTKMLRTKDVVARLELSQSTVYRLLRSGQLVGRRMGGPKAGWRVTEAALSAFLAVPPPPGLPMAPLPRWDQADDVPDAAPDERRQQQ